MSRCNCISKIWCRLWWFSSSQTFSGYYIYLQDNGYYCSLIHAGVTSSKMHDQLLLYHMISYITWSVVTISHDQWLLYRMISCYIAWSVVTISHDQLYRMISGYYIARSVVTISHDQWLLYRMISGYYIAWSVVTISHDQLLLYRMISGYYIHR